MRAGGDGIRVSDGSLHNTTRSNYVRDSMGTDISVDEAYAIVKSNDPSFGVHRGLSPSSGSVTVTFDKPHIEKPELNASVEAEAVWWVLSWSTDGNGHYTDATLSFVNTGGVSVNPTTHVYVEGYGKDY